MKNTPEAMSLQEFRRRQAEKEADRRRNAMHKLRVALNQEANRFRAGLANLDVGSGTEAHQRMMRDNPDLKRFHPDYGGVPGKGVPKKQWYGTGNHPLKR